METIMSHAQQIKEELLEIRRSLHSHPEVGSSLPYTKAFVSDKLRSFGYEPEEICESCIVAVLKGAKSGKTLMLRADMDALKIVEKADLPFAANNGCMHACGHDMHVTMLLGAAKLLKEHQEEISGNIKFVFQPNEEGFEGAKAMLKAGVLESPKVDAAMALHVNSGTPSGLVLGGKGTSMAGCIFFRIKVKGTGCHGAMPDTGVDPINIAAHIHLSLQEIIAREVSPTTPATLTIGRFIAGEAPNIIPEEVLIEGSIRTMDKAIGDYIYHRIEEISTQTATLFRGQVSVEEICSVPPLKNNDYLVTQMAGFIGEMIDPRSIVLFENGGMGSEDFSVISQEVPCSYLLLGAGTAEEKVAYGKPMHNECVVFNEDVLPIGTAIFSHCALRWLQG